ncbi:hypothetical protein Tco_0606658 [Tanacetum coccineum]
MSSDNSENLDILDVDPIDPEVEAATLPKFDMHLYKSSLSETDIKWLTKCYKIPKELHPRIVPEGMTMDQLPNDAIGFVADPFPKPKEFDASDDEKLCEVVITLHKPRLSLLYIAGLVSAGALVASGAALETHLTSPANRVEDIPPKTKDMETVDVPCRKHVFVNASANWLDALRNQTDEHGSPRHNVVHENVDENMDGNVGNKHGVEDLVNEGHSQIQGVQKDMGKLKSVYDENVSAYNHPKEDYDGSLNREKGGVEKSKEHTHLLRVDREKYAVECGNREMRSLGEVFSLAIGKGFIDGVSIGRKMEDIQAILAATPNVDPASSATFMGSMKSYSTRDTPMWTRLLVPTCWTLLDFKMSCLTKLVLRPAKGLATS